MENIIFFSLSFFVSWGIYYYSIQHEFLMDQPNGRSSHVQAVSKAGGLVLLAMWQILVGYVVLKYNINASMYAFSQIPFLFGVLGWVDDACPQSARLRLVVQSVLVLLALFLSGAQVSWWLFLLFFLFGVWWVNLYNFMDGIDGLASSYAIGTLCIIFIIAPISHVFLLFIFALLGFFPFNFLPARLFLGNSGSYFLGGVLFCTFLVLFVGYNISIPELLLITFLFLGEATFVLSLRFFQGKKVQEAHKTHIYQLLAQRLQDYFISKKNTRLPKARMLAHASVVFLYFLLNSFIVVPLILQETISIEWVSGLLICQFFVLLNVYFALKRNYKIKQY